MYRTPFFLHNNAQPKLIHLVNISSHQIVHRRLAITIDTTPQIDYHIVANTI